MKIFDGFFLFISTLVTVRRLHCEFGFDLIDAHFAYPDGFAAVLLGRLLRIPVVVTLHGTSILLLPFRMRSALVDWTIRHATRVIAVAPNLEARARQARVAPDRLAVIPNGVDPFRFSPIDRSTARNCVGMPSSGLLIVSVGHVSPRKGFQRVIRILPRLAEHHPTSHLRSSGARAQKPITSQYCNVSHTRSAWQIVCDLPGACSPDDVANWLCAADLFVLASDFEACPNVVWEALACGRPVVATRVGLIEYMVPPFAGILFDDPEDAEQLLEARVQRYQAHLERRTYPRPCRGSRMGQNSRSNFLGIPARHWRSPARKLACTANETGQHS